MGAVASRCNDVSMDKGGSAKPLDASSSEEEEEDEEEEDEEDEEDDTADRTEAEAALQETLKRGKTTAFKEVIEHATAIGIDEDKIMKAEALLEQHKAQRRREAFEQELDAFMVSPEVDNLEACESKRRQGEQYGVSAASLSALVDKIEDLKMRLDLNQDEQMQARRYLEACCRRFVATSAVGRSTSWCTLQTGKLQKVTLVLDPALKYLKIQSLGNEVLETVSLALLAPQKPDQSDQVVESEAYDRLTDQQRDNCLAVTGAADIWLFIEEDRMKVDEMLVGLTMLNGLGLDGSGGGGGKSASPSKAKKKDGKSPRAASPRGDASPRGKSSPRPPSPTAEASPEKDKKEKKEKKEDKDEKEEKEDKDEPKAPAGLEVEEEEEKPEPVAEKKPKKAKKVKREGVEPSGSAFDIDAEMPYGDLEPFGREDTAQELTEASIKESNAMVDQLERAEVAEEKRAVFRALTRLRGAAITSFDGVARSQTGNIDEYNKVNKWRKTHPLHHLAQEESDVSRWAFPNNAD